MRMIPIVLQILVVFLGAGFLFIGVAGLVRPAQVAEVLFLTPEQPIGLGSIRAVVGGHYVALGFTAIYAAVRRSSTLLVPIAAVEAFMVAARIISGIAGELSPAGMTAAGIEVVASLVVIACVTLPVRTTAFRR